MEAPAGNSGHRVREFKVREIQILNPFYLSSDVSICKGIARSIKKITFCYYCIKILSSALLPKSRAQYWAQCRILRLIFRQDWSFCPGGGATSACNKGSPDAMERRNPLQNAAGNQ
jgi:hypothetical protein